MPAASKAACNSARVALFAETFFGAAVVAVAAGVALGDGAGELVAAGAPVALAVVAAAEGVGVGAFSPGALSPQATPASRPAATRDVNGSNPRMSTSHDVVVGTGAVSPGPATR
jgi:hypothetical protein